MTAVSGRLALIAAAAGLLLAPPAGVAGPATAAGPSTNHCHLGAGVTVVVDGGPLGTGLRTGCDREGGANAADSTTAAGFQVTYASGQPFVCRIDGRPLVADEPCDRTPPADAYWGLFWSNGKDGVWHYATLGVTALEVPAGGFVGWRFEDGPREDPGVAPTGTASSSGASTHDDSADQQAPETSAAWVAGAVLVLLGGGSAAVAWRRRGQRSTS